jgi:hemolysin D
MAQQGELTQTQVMVEKMRSQLETRSMIAQSDLQSQEATVIQNESMAETQTVLNRQIGEEIAVQRQRIERFRILANEGAYPRDQVTQMEQAVRERERSITEVDGKLQQAIGDRARLKAERERKQSEAVQVQLSTQQEIEQLRLRQAEIRGKMQEAQAQIATAKAKKDQRYVYAPASGIVTTLNLKHTGQVVQPGEAIAEISPQGKPLILSTLLPSHEAGFVKPGMTTQIKLDAFPYQDFGLVSGKVLSVSPDSKAMENGSQVYRVDIALDRPTIQVRNQKIELKTGLTGTAEIMTRRRRIMDLLLDPIRQLQGNISL